jgi:hypothetical protein
MDFPVAFNQIVASGEKFDVLYINTPLEEITIPIDQIANEKSLLFLWVDSYSVDKAIRFLDTFGFKFHEVVHLLDVASYPWNKKEKKAAPTEVALEPAAEVEPSEAEEGVKSMEDGEEKSKKAQAPRKPRVRIAPIAPPTWWSEKPDSLKHAKNSTEQLWLAVRGADTFQPDGDQTFFDLFANDKAPQVPYQVLFAPDLGKRTKNKLVANRPVSVLHEVLSQLKPELAVAELFAPAASDVVTSIGPEVPGGFLPRMDRAVGINAAIKDAIVDMKKVQMRKLHSDLHKMLAPSTTPEATKVLVDDTAPVFTKIAEGIKGIPITYDLTTEAGEILPPTWLISLVDQFVKRDLLVTKNKHKRRRRRAVSGDRPKHGIAAPMIVSAELRAFLELQPDERIARTTAVKKINTYIKANNLQNPAKKIEIILDDKLQALLAPPAEFGPITYFNLCRLLGKHFSKPEGVESAADTSDLSPAEPEGKRQKV